MGKDTGLDAILKELGPFGKYNIINYALLLFPVYLAGMYGTVFVFQAPDINYRCQISECEHLNNSLWLDHAIPKERGNFVKCHRYAFTNNNSNTCEHNDFNNSKIHNCDNFLYSNEDSAVKDFNLGCQYWKITLIGTIHNTGLIVALPITGFFSDKYGRKLALSVASFMNGIFGVLRSFSYNYPMLIMLEFLEAATGAGTFNTAFVIAMELVVPRGRVFGNTLINIFYVLGLMTLSGLAWWLQSWRTLLRVIYTPSLFVVSYYWIINDSVRWLLSKGRHKEASMILQKAAKINKVELSHELLAPLNEFEKANDSNKKGKKTASYEVKSNKEPSNFSKVLKSSILRKRVLVCSFLWITCSFVYYGLSINSVTLAGSIYVNFMMVCFVEIPANFMCIILLDKFGRKRVLMNTFMLSACMCLCLSFLPKGQKWWALFLYLSGKFSITVAYSSVYIYVSEVFPTSVRQFLLAVCASLGRVGSATAPLTPLLALYYDNLPATFFGCMALISSFIVLSLPETINVALPDTIEEAEALSQKTREEAYS